MVSIVLDDVFFFFKQYTHLLFLIFFDSEEYFARK